MYVRGKLPFIPLIGPPVGPFCQGDASAISIQFVKGGKRHEIQ